MAMSIESLRLHILPIVLGLHFTFITGQRFTLRGQSYPNHGLVLIDEIGETMFDLDPNNGLNCMSDLSDCCMSGLRGEFDFPDGSVVPTLGSIRNGYYRTRGADRNILNRRSEGMVQGLFQCRIRTLASQTEYEEFYIGVYDENSGVPTVDSVSTSGLTLTCTSSGGPATSVTWRRNCAVLPNNATYQQTQTVTQTQTATYQNTLVIDSAVTDHDGVYTCSVTNARGYGNGNTGLGASYEPTLPLTVAITPSSSPVAGGSLFLTCGSTASTPTYQWINEAGMMIGTEATLTLNPLLESHSGEYSCLVTDGAIVGCGVHRVTVQAPSVTVTVGGVDGVTAGSTSQTLTCSVSGVNVTANAVTSVMYTWLHDGSVVQAASTSNQYTIPSMSLGVNNAGDEYTCQVAITANYWDVSGSFGDSGSGNLSLIIPDPTVQLGELPLVSVKYVGLNFIWRCIITLPGQQLPGVDAVVEWKKSNNNLTSSNDGRITVGDPFIDTPGRIYWRSVNFSPLSEDDVASYSCLGTIMPTVANPRVTNGFGRVDGSLAVTVPTLDVSIDRAGVPAQIIDAPPFNGFPLICMATSRVAGVETAIRKRITWTRSVNGGSVQQLTDGASVDDVVMVMEDNLLQARSMSMLMVNTSVSGNHSYTCRAELVVAPAPDMINVQNQTTITVVGAPTTSPLTPPTVATAGPVFTPQTVATDLPPEPVLTPPSEVESHCSLVTWRNSPNVSCEDIIGYDVRVFNPDTEEEVIRRVDARGTFHNFLLMDKDLTELKSTTVQIRIVSSTGVGTYSSPVEVGCFIPQPSSVYFELKGIRYENNSAVNITAIDEGDNALLCRTNKQECCGSVPNRFGEFFYPNGVKVPIRIAGEGFYRNRGDQLIRLNRRSGTSSPTGKYFCEIPDANGVIQKIIITIDVE